MFDVLAMTVEELRIELQRCGKIPAGTKNPDLQEALLNAIADPPNVAQDQYSTALLSLTLEMKILVVVLRCRQG